MISIGIFIALEVLQHESAGPQGINVVHISQSTALVWSTFIPALVMAGVKLLYQSGSFQVYLFTPYALLSRGRHKSRIISSRNAVGSMAIVNIGRSLRYGGFGVAFASLAVVFSSFLTTLVSNLYSIEQYSPSHEITLKSSSYFDFHRDPFDFDAEELYTVLDPAIFSLIDQYNASYPALTYDELVFPAISGIEVVEGTVKVSIPAFRASLDCVFGSVESKKFTVGRNPNPYSSDPKDLALTVVDNVHVPPICYGKTHPDSAITDFPAQIPIHRLKETYGSSVEYLFWQDGTGERTISYPCFTIGFVFGYFKVNGTSAENVTTMHCFQQIEELDTETTFLLPSMVVDTKNPPVVDEGSMRVLLPMAEYRTAFDVRAFSTFLTTADNADLSSIDHLSDLTPLDPFYRHVVYGIDGIPEEELLGFENRDRLLSATQHIYRKYMSQSINVNMRRETSATYPPQTYQATLAKGQALRLVQNEGPKIALQVLLGLMLICGTAAYALTPMRGVLPHNPLSIAGSMSLLAGSELCGGGVVPAGAEFMADEEIERVFAGYVFSLGWMKAFVPPGNMDHVPGMRFGIEAWREVD